MTSKEKIRIRNPFHDPLVTELIEEPTLYHEMFSERVLVGETLEVFQPSNVVLVGSQGSGKSMILNLVRYSVLSEFISATGKLPSPLEHLTPFFGISINLVRANVHGFGRRSISRAMTGGKNESLEATCAADFLSHYLFREFLIGLEFLFGKEGCHLRNWMSVDKKRIKLSKLVRTMATWDCWFGYYVECDSLKALRNKCEKRLLIWRSFLNTNIDKIPEDIWKSKSTIGDPLHAMGNLLNSIGSGRDRLPLFVVIDQYEELITLNPAFGGALQRMINTLIKARDPVVFYKIGTRTYMWGKELRILESESRIEVQRDYVIINLADVLMRNEDSGGWLFPDFVKDVTYKRVKCRYKRIRKRNIIKEMLGKWSPDEEAELYFGENKERRLNVLRRVSEPIREKILSLCGESASTLQLRLAAAWALQKLQKGIMEREILEQLEGHPWNHPWWKKERVEVALLQIASIANQRKLYYGWDTVLYLSGANISAFLLLCSEIWDTATRMDINPLEERPLPPNVQTEGIFDASRKWRNRDRDEHRGGQERYGVLSRLGTGIHNKLITDLAISNPGHSGWSLKETGLYSSEKGQKVAELFHNAVCWAIFEERPHTSKLREAVTRRKWYLHPLLSPAFAIPYKRVKEPLYVSIDDVYNWIYSKEELRFGRVKSISDKWQLRLPFEEQE